MLIPRTAPLAVRRLVRCLPVLALLAVLLPIGGTARGEPAVTLLELPGGGCGPANVEGWEFKTTESITVSALGAFNRLFSSTSLAVPDPGLAHDIPVGLYDSSCTLLAQATVPAGTVAARIDFYRFVSITPLQLAADQTFRLAAVIRCDDSNAFVGSLDEVTLHPALSDVRNLREGFADELTCPAEIASNLNFAPNMLIGAPCGNGLRENDEQCDDGNLEDGDCCSPTCQITNQGGDCPDDGEPCTADVCGDSGTCTHPAGNPGTPCREAAADCDAVELCDGAFPFCPEDELAADGTPCTDDGLFCSGEERCFEGFCNSAGDPCQDDTACFEASDECRAPTPTLTPPASATRTPTTTGTLTLTATGTPTLTATGTPTLTATTRSATPTQPSPAATATAVATSTAPVLTATATATAASPATATATPPGGVCLGDCDDSGVISIGELITAVGIALGAQPIDACRAIDASANGSVEINELIAAVANALSGCA